MIEGRYQGHKITYNGIDGKWHFQDGSIWDKDNVRSCVLCGRMPSVDGHDACLVNLPGVKNACCGHGVEDGYIQFENGIVIRGKFKIEK